MCREILTTLEASWNLSKCFYAHGRVVYLAIAGAFTAGRLSIESIYSNFRINIPMHSSFSDFKSSVSNWEFNLEIVFNFAALNLSGAILELKVT